MAAFVSRGPRPTRLPLWFAAAALLTISVSAQAEVAVSELARKHFTAGVAYLQDPDGARYEDAYREFKAAYAESPSWKILGNIGLTSMKLERDGEAIEAYREYLRQGGSEIDPEERAQIQRDYDTLSAGLVTIAIETVPVGATISDERVTVRGERIVNMYGATSGSLKLGLRAGHHRVTASLSGYTDQTWEFEARPSTSESHTFSLQPATAPGTSTTPLPAAAPPPEVTPIRSSRPIPTGVYVGLAATGALAIGATVTGLMATSKHKDFDDQNDGSNPAKAQDLRDSGVKLNLITDVLLGGAVVAAAVTTVLYLGRPQQEQSALSRHWVPVADAHGGGVYYLTQF